MNVRHLLKLGVRRTVYLSDLLNKIVTYMAIIWVPTAASYSLIIKTSKTLDKLNYLFKQ